MPTTIGTVVDAALPWALLWPGVAGPRHPSPLYQMLIGGALVFVLLWSFAGKSRPRPRLAVGAIFCSLYGSARFCTEYFRTPDYELVVSLGKNKTMAPGADEAAWAKNRRAVY